MFSLYIVPVLCRFVSLLLFNKWLLCEANFAGESWRDFDDDIIFRASPQSNSAYLHSPQTLFLNSPTFILNSGTKQRLYPVVMGYYL